MSVYSDLVDNPPKLEVKANAREVIVNLVSCMCDNRYETVFKKNSDGDFEYNTCGQAYRNFQIKHSKLDLEWVADEGDWDNVFRMINTGVVVIEKVRSR